MLNTNTNKQLVKVTRMTQISILPINFAQILLILSYPAQILFNPARILFNPVRSAINCDNYEGENVIISIIMMFQTQKFQKEIYIISVTFK